MLAIKIHFYSKRYCIFFPQRRMSNFIPWLLFFICPEEACQNFTKIAPSPSENNDNSALFFCSLKTVSKERTFSLSVSSDSGKSDFLQRPFECGFPSSLLLLCNTAYTTA